MAFKTPLMTLFAFCLATAGMAQEASVPDAPPRLVKLIGLAEQEGVINRRFFGRVVAKSTVDLAFQVGGQIVDFPVLEGEPIGKGGVIAQLDLEPFELSLEQAQLEQEQADRTLERLRKLEGNTVSQVTVEDAETAAALADVAVRNAERSLNNATLTAPFDALVAVRNVDSFTTINAGTAAVRLHDLSEVRMEIDVPEVLFQKAGEDPDVSLFAKFPASDQLFEVETREFNAQTSEVGQTFRITLGMAPVEGLVILPGSSVEVTAILAQGEPTLEIPYSAVIFDPSGAPAVMVFEPAGAAEGTVRKVSIATTSSNEGTLLVTDGLDPGMEIVASGASLLSDGDTVRRFTGFPK